MPELPEVETIVKGLKSKIIDKKIIDFDNKDEKKIKVEKKSVIGHKITNIERRAKMIVIELNGQESILAHLKMTGQLIWEERQGKKEFCLRNRVSGGHPDNSWFQKLPNKHTRAIFHFDDKSVLYFNDLRRFGWLRQYQTDELKNLRTKELKNIGVEPFSNDFNLEYLKKRAEKIANHKIKQYLIDQEVVAGIGNIYADESLFHAGILPERAVSKINDKEWKKIIESVKKALNLGIKYGGSSEESYVNALGKPGEAQKHVFVYRRTGQKCKKCDNIIQKIKLGGRSTHFCPGCQK